MDVDLFSVNSCLAWRLFVIKGVHTDQLMASLNNIMSICHREQHDYKDDNAVLSVGLVQKTL